MWCRSARVQPLIPSGSAPPRGWGTTCSIPPGEPPTSLAAFGGSPRIPLWVTLNAQGQAVRGGYTDAAGVALAWGNGGLVNWSLRVGRTVVNGAPNPQGSIHPVDSATAETIDYAVRGTTITDYRPRVISNLVAIQTGVDPQRIIDNPRLNGNIRMVVPATTPSTVVAAAWTRS